MPVDRALDRRALERVLARAAELQAMSSDTPDILTEEQILELGREVGLPAAHLRQAMSEERTRVAVPTEEGWVGRVFGASHATATRVVVGRPSDVLARLDEWMRKRESLGVKRRFGDRMTWERSRNFISGLQRTFSMSGHDYALARADEIAATVYAVDDHRTMVRLDADLTELRRGHAQNSGLTAGVGVLSGGAVAVVGAILVAPTAVAFAAVTAGAAVPVIFGGAGAWLVARQHLRATQRVQLGLEQVLDGLESRIA